MQVTIEQADLARLVKAVWRHVKSANIPALACLRLDAKDGTLTIAGTDLAVYAEATIAATVDKPGQALVPGKVLTELAKKFQPGPVTFTAAADGLWTKIACGPTTVDLRSTVTVADFPKGLNPDEGDGWVLSGPDATAVAKQVAAIASKDEGRLILGGVLVEVDGDVIEFIATDSYRLARRSITHVGTQAEPSSAIVPAYVFTDVIADAGGEKVTLTFGDASVTFSLDGLRVTVNQLDGAYPDWRKIAAVNEPSTNIVVDRKALLAAAERMLMLDAGGPLRLDPDPDADLVVLMEGPDSSGTDAIPADIDGERVQVAFNPRYLAHALEHLPTEQVHIGLNGALKAAHVTGIGDDELHVVLMPTRIK